MAVQNEVHNNSLFKQWAKIYSTLEDSDIQLLISLKNSFNNDLLYFYKMNRILENGNGYLRETNIGMEFEVSQGLAQLRTSQGYIRMDIDEFRKVIITLIDVYSPIYPMGTILEIDKSLCKNMFKDNVKNNIKVVVTYRFITSMENFYIPMIGMLYPAGPLYNGRDKVSFTPSAVVNVISMGYKDEAEMEFIRKTKVEYILKRNMNSISFATKHDIKAELDKIQV